MSSSNWCFLTGIQIFLGVFPTFFNLSLNFARSSWAEPQSTLHLIFCWLCRTFPSLAVKKIINMISVLTIWWCPCVELSLVLLKKGVFYDQCSIDRTMSAFAQLHFVLKDQTCLFSEYLLTSYFCISIPYDRNDNLFLVLVQENMVGLHRTS